MKIEDGRKRGWFWIENGIFDYGIANQIGSSALIVYFALCRHANKEGKSFPSVKKLQFETGLSNKVIANSIDILKHCNLLEVQREKHQYNIYTIKTVDNATCLNKKEKVASVESTPAQQQVKNLHEARVGSTPEHVKNLHEAGVDSTHKGNTIKETQLRNINITTTTSKLSIEKSPKNSSQNDNKKPTTTSGTTVESLPDDDNGLVFDFALQDFSPEQQRRAFNLLKNIPTEDKQSVLDEFNSALKRGTVNSPWHYLNTLVKKYQTGEFTATSELPDQRAQIQKAHQRQQEIEACPYCNEQGTLYFSSPQQSITMPCNHKAKEIVNYAIKHNAEIVLAQPGYRYPSQSQCQPLTPAEIQQTKAKLAALIGGFQCE